MDVSASTPARPHDPARADCPGRSIFETVTNRWTFLILWCLKDGSLRFYELRDAVEGISERVLSENLKKLGRDGLVSRNVEPTRPPKVSYTLTPIGAELTEVVGQLADWIDRRTSEIEKARERYDQT